MKQNERHQYILDKLKVLGHVYVNDLSQDLNVSPVTIRKDLSLLENKALLYRIHGGASLTDPYIQDRLISEKIQLNYNEKLALAQQAKTYIKPGDSLIIGSGTTMAILAKQIKSINNLTIITASLAVAMELNENPSHQVIILGGPLRTSSHSSIGSFAELMLEDYVCKKLFLSVDGLNFHHGLTTANVQEARLNRKMMEQCDQIFLLADQHKIGKTSLGKIARLDRIDHLITNHPTSEKTKEKLLSYGFAIDFID